MWELLQAGARVYVCGDGSRMAPGVRAAFRDAARRPAPAPRPGIRGLAARTDRLRALHRGRLRGGLTPPGAPAVPRRATGTGSPGPPGPRWRVRPPEPHRRRPQAKAHGPTWGTHGMTKALIIGGGIAGAVTAMALQKAGIEAEIFEAYPTGADDVGAFLVVFANGLEALRVIDAHGPVVDHSFPAQRVELIGDRGTRTRGAAPRRASRRARNSARAPCAAPPSTRCCTPRRRAAASPCEHGKRLVGAETVHASEGKRVVASFADGSRRRGRPADRRGRPALRHPHPHRPGRAAPPLHRPEHRLRLHRRRHEPAAPPTPTP